MTTIINGSSPSITFSDATTQATAVPAPSAIGQVPFSTDGSTYTPTAKISSGTSVASTSGNSITFSSIPSWVKRVTVMFNGVKTSGSSIPIILLQTSGGTVSTGYLSYGWSNNASSSDGNTTGFYLAGIWATSSALNGMCSLTLLNPSTNLWVENSVAGGGTSSANKSISMGNVTLSSALTGIVIQAANGTDTFSAGSINILYE